MKRYRFFIILVILAGLAIYIRPKASVLKSLPQLANSVVRGCAQSSYRPGCYDEKIPELMTKISFEEAFEVTRLVQQQDPEYTYCHVLGHKLAAVETAKDPSKWKEVIGRCPVGVCSNGCVHGAFQERFRSETMVDEEIEKIKPELQSACEARPGWQPTGMQRATCYHALGHLLMYITSAEIVKSTTLCDEIALKSDTDFRPVCYDGAFMQIFQPLEPEDFALISGREQTRDTVQSFCSLFNGNKRTSCRTESWPLFRDEILKPDGPAKHCTWLPIAEQGRCLNGLFYVAAAQFNLDFTKISDFCSRTSTATRNQCFAQSASRLIEVEWGNVDQAIRLCQTADSVGSGPACFRELDLFATFNFPANSAYQQQLCRQIPVQFRTQCR